MLSKLRALLVLMLVLALAVPPAAFAEEAGSVQSAPIGDANDLNGSGVSDENEVSSAAGAEQTRASVEQTLVTNAANGDSPVQIFTFITDKTSVANGIPVVHGKFKAKINVNTALLIDSVSIIINGKKTNMVPSDQNCTFPCQTYEAAVDIASQPGGEKQAVIAVATASGTYEQAFPIIHHNKAYFNIESPSTYIVADPSLHVKASCQDGRGYDCKIKLNIEFGSRGGGFQVTDYQSSIDQAIHLDRYYNQFKGDEEFLNLVFTAIDSLGQVTTESRTIAVEANPNADKVFDLNDEMLRGVNLDTGKLLLGSGKIKDLNTGQITSPPENIKFTSRSLLDHGVAYYYYGELSIWSWATDKVAKYELTYTDCQNANGDYLTFCTRSTTTPYKQELRVMRVSTGQVDLVETSGFVATSISVSENGAVLYTTTDGSLRQYKNGTRTVVADGTAQPGGAAASTNKGRIEGDTIVYERKTAERTELFAIQPNGSKTRLESSTVFDKFDSIFIHNGWIYYNATDNEGADYTYVIAPSGDKEQIYPQLAGIEAVSDNGQLMTKPGYPMAGSHYLSYVLNGKRELVPVVSHRAQVRWTGGDWHAWEGGALFKLAPPQELNAPVWPAGSKIEIVKEDSTSIELAWNAAYDDSEIAGYQIVTQQGLIDRVPAATRRYSLDKRLYFNSSTFKIIAIDPYGNTAELAGPDLSWTRDITRPKWPAGSALKASETTTRSTELSWPTATDPEGVTAFRVYNGPYLVAEVPASRHTYTIDDLNPNTSYTFRVTAGDKKNNWSDELKTTISTPNEADATAPAWPSGSKLQASDIAPNGAKLTWNSATDNRAVTAYRIMNGANVVATVAAPNLTTTLMSLAPNTTYTLDIAAGDAAGNWTKGPSVTFKTTSLPTDTMKPNWPAGSHAIVTGLTGGSVSLEWTAALDNEAVTGYRITSGMTVVGETPDGTTLAWTVTGLTPKMDYELKIEARDEAGNWSTNGPTVWIRTTGEADAQAPTWPEGSEASAESVTATSAVLKWTAAMDNVAVAGYRIKRGDTVLASTNGPALSRTLANLQPDKDYALTIEAVDAAGNWSANGLTVAFKTLAAEPEGDTAPPTWPSGSKVTSGGTTPYIALISWTPAADNVGVTGYRILNGPTVLAEVDGTTRTRGIEGLTPNTEYTLKVEARDAAGNWSTDGPAITVKTLPKDAPAPDTEAPTWAPGSKVTSGGTTPHIALISWTPASDNIGVTGYRIMSGDTVLAEVDGTTRTKGIEGLKSNTEYALKIEARDAADNWSTGGPTVTVKTLPISS
ncbi:fibronectin type III domain-containing protein [Paenibacillus aurantiacus]|uniref:Fibronectin type III domain-containing protein n=1 Tax=Paenibacillus aurantiacus TaxID=1936118 RepID=A0ABV5KMK7_9BACL